MANITESCILTCSARDYADSMGKHLSLYELKGVISYEKGLEGFISKIPREAEVVTDFQFNLSSIDSRFSYLAGTALIPKDK